MAHEDASDTEHADSDSTATLVSQVAPVVEYAASPALNTDDVKSAARPTVPEHDKVSLQSASDTDETPADRRSEPELLRAAIRERLDEECMVRKAIKEALRQLVDSCGHSHEPSEEQYLVFRHTIDPLHRKCQDLMREIWFYQGKLARCAAPASA
ncbi:hypothetical protein IWQ56_000558 [Coemansia nantahalensis]|nr:hypothetical protein IWQ56_000558 [Coemansia nantahalensis]